MNKAKTGFAFLVCLALISCTININTGAKIDPEYAVQMTLTAIADKYFNNQPARNPTGQPLANPQPQVQPPAQPQNQQPLSPPQESVVDITPSITPTPIPCLLLGKVVDVTLPDSTQLQPGTSETKTWRLTNKGSCAWDSSFAIAYKSGNLPVRNTYVNLDRTVRPGETIEVSVPVMAPQTPGTYTSYFWLRDGSGNFFGSGAGANQTFWAKIVVPELFKVTKIDYMYNEVAKNADSQGRCIHYITFFITTNGPCVVKYFFDIHFIFEDQTTGTMSSNLLEIKFSEAGTQQLSFKADIREKWKVTYFLWSKEPNSKQANSAFTFECKKSS